MANKVPENPVLPVPGTQSALGYLTVFYRSLLDVLRTIVRRVNAAYVADGTETATGPIIPASYTVTTLPDVTTKGIIFVSDETGGPTIAYSDGTDWRRVSDGSVVS